MVGSIVGEVRRENTNPMRVTSPPGRPNRETQRFLFAMSDRGPQADPRAAKLPELRWQTCPHIALARHSLAGNIAGIKMHID